MPANDRTRTQQDSDSALVRQMSHWTVFATPPEKPNGSDDDIVEDDDDEEFEDDDEDDDEESDVEDGAREPGETADEDKV
jgi:hypothetical protein